MGGVEKRKTQQTQRKEDRGEGSTKRSNARNGGKEVRNSVTREESEESKNRGRGKKSRDRY
jgi:hypothetical protein